MHTALTGQGNQSIGVDNTWVRDVSIVLPTFVTAIDDVTMAFAKRLQVDCSRSTSRYLLSSATSLCRAAVLSRMVWQLRSCFALLCAFLHVLNPCLCDQAMLAGMASVAGSEASPLPTRRGSADAALSANGTESMTMQSVTERLAALETGLMAQAAAVAAKRCGDPAWLWVPTTSVSCLVTRCNVCTCTERN